MPLLKGGRIRLAEMRALLRQLLDIGDPVRCERMALQIGIGPGAREKIVIGEALEGFSIMPRADWPVASR